MRIALVGPAHPTRGGIAHFSMGLARALRSRHELSFISFSRLYPRWAYPGNTAPDPHPPANPVAAEMILDGLDPTSWRSVGRRFTELRPDVVVLQWWTPFFTFLHGSLSRAARAAGIPVLTIAHQLVEPDGSPAGRFLTRRVLAHSHGVVGLHEADVGRIRRMLPKLPVRLAPLPNLIDHFGGRPERQAARRRLHLDPTARILVFFGFVRRYKGVDLLLEALSEVPEVQLLIAGEFWEREAPYRALVSRHGLEARVHIRNGYQPDAMVTTLLAAADAVVLPYRRGGQSAVAVAAVAMGVPVIATDVGALPEVVDHGHTGIIVPANDPRALAAAIRRLDRDGFVLPHGNQRRREPAHSWTELARVVEDLATELSGAGDAAP